MAFLLYKDYDGKITTILYCII